jgi:hypothetical protein
MVGSFVLGMSDPIYTALGRLGVFVDGPVLAIFEYPDDDSRFIGAVCSVVVASAACWSVRRVRGKACVGVAVGLLPFLFAFAAGALWLVRLLHLPAPEANTAVRLWFGVVAVASLAGSVAVARVQRRGIR